jgi:hypothetical protein
VKSFEGLGEAAAAAARDLLRDGDRTGGVREPTSIGSGFRGQPRAATELLGYTFRLRDPTLVVLDRPAAPVNVPFIAANLLWAVAGSDRVEEIDYWNGRAAAFADEANRIPSALGPRLAVVAADGQLQAALRRLRTDPETRRAVMMLLQPSDLVVSTRDVPCIAMLQLLLRAGRLHAVAVMRSQSALLVLPYDVPVLAGLQSLMAAELGVPVGTYTHFAGSLHVYDDELPLAEEVATAQPRSVRLPAPPSIAAVVGMHSFALGLATAAIPDLVEAGERAELGASEFERKVGTLLVGEAARRAGAADLASQMWQHAGPLGQLAAARHSGRPASRDGRTTDERGNSAADVTGRTSRGF